MPRQARKISISSIYHIIHRGIDRNNLFFDNQDFRKYLVILKKYIKEGGYDVLAYCLMDNHVHLLIHFHNDVPGPFVQKLSISYSSYFNKKYNRVGHLFQNRFKSEPIDDDRYFLSVIKYIHNNPQKAGICSASLYKWSSFHEYTEKASIINTQLLFEMLGGKEQFCHYMENEELSIGLDYDEKRKADSDAVRIIKRVLEKEDVNYLRALKKDQRDQIIERILSQGVSGKQLSRICGISYSTILRGKKKR